MLCVGPGEDNDTRLSFNNDCLPLLPPMQPKPKIISDDDYNHIHCSGMPPLAATPSKHSIMDQNYPIGTGEKYHI